MAFAAQTAPPLLRVTLPPRLARFLVAAGARRAATDSMIVEFKHQELRDEVLRRRKLALQILRARADIRELHYMIQLGPVDRESILLSIDHLERAVDDVQRVAEEDAKPHIDLKTAIRLVPRTYSDARTIGEVFHEGRTVILDLSHLGDSDAKRFVDFAAGLIFGLAGSIDRLGNRTFLLAPPPDSDRWQYAPPVDVWLFDALYDVKHVLDALRNETFHVPDERAEELRWRLASLAEKLQADALPLDLSHVDLSGRKLTLDDLAGAIWSRDTKWPKDIGDRILDESDEIRPGVYRVRGGLVARSTI
jgi:hypothetical protein